MVEFSNLGLVMGVVWNMTQKPGWGEAIAAAVIGWAVGVVLALLVTRSAKEQIAAAGAPDAAS